MLLCTSLYCLSEHPIVSNKTVYCFQLYVLQLPTGFSGSNSDPWIYKCIPTPLSLFHLIHKYIQIVHFLRCNSQPVLPADFKKATLSFTTTVKLIFKIVLPNGATYFLIVMEILNLFSLSLSSLFPNLSVFFSPLSPVCSVIFVPM